MDFNSTTLDKTEFAVFTEGACKGFGTEEEARQYASYRIAKGDMLVLIAHVTHHVTPPAPDIKPVYRGVLNG